MLGESVLDSFIGGTSGPSNNGQNDVNPAGIVFGEAIRDKKFMAMMRMLQMEQNEYMEKRELQKEQVAWARDVIASGKGQDQGEITLDF